MRHPPPAHASWHHRFLTASARQRPHRGRVLAGVGAVAVAAVLLGGVAWQRSDNFHTVLEGRLYRSAQMDPTTLEGRIARHQLRSIINLRGPSRTAGWYREEREMAQRHGVRLCDLPLQSTSPLTPSEMRKLVRVLEECPKPALIHCQSGIDRTGLVAVIAVLLLGDVGAPQGALAELRLVYGHLPWRRSSVWTTNLVEAYGRWLAANGACHSRERFRAWARRGYAPEVLRGEDPERCHAERGGGSEPARPAIGRAGGVSEII